MSNNELRNELENVILNNEVQLEKIEELEEMIAAGCGCGCGSGC